FLSCLDGQPAFQGRVVKRGFVVVPVLRGSIGDGGWVERTNAGAAGEGSVDVFRLNCVRSWRDRYFVIADQCGIATPECAATAVVSSDALPRIAGERIPTHNGYGDTQ